MKIELHSSSKFVIWFVHSAPPKAVMTSAHIDIWWHGADDMIKAFVCNFPEKTFTERERKIQN